MIRISMPHRIILWAGVLGAVLMPRFGQATTVGNIFSGPTTGDALSVFWNPAAMTRVRGTEILIFGSLTPIWSQYQADHTSAFDGKPYPEATVAMVAPGGALGAVTDFGLKDFRFGLGFSAPHVAGSNWARSYDGRPSLTRYYTEDSYGITLLSQLTGAWRVNRYISIGGGLDVNTTLTRFRAQLDFSSKINMAVCASDPSTCRVNSPLRRENPDFDAFIHNQGHGWTLGMSAGVLITPWPWLRFAASLHTGGEARYPVQLNVELPPAVVNYLQAELPTLDLTRLVAQVDVVVQVPMLANFSAAININPAVELALDFEWHNSSETSVLLANVLRDQSGGLIQDIVLVKGKRDLWQLTARGTYQLNPTWRLAFRMEYRPSTRPEEFVTPISADFRRIVLHAGARFKPVPYFAVTVELAQFFLFSQTVRHTRFGPNPTATTPQEVSLDKPLPTGAYSAQAFRLGLTGQFFF